MTSETKEQKEKRELIYFRERARSKRQIYQLIKNLFFWLLEIGIGYFVFSWAIYGIERSGYAGYRIGQIFVFFVSGLWAINMFCRWPQVVAPVSEDSKKWGAQFFAKIRAVKEAWGKANNKIKVPK